MCNTFQDRNNNFGKNNYDPNYLNHVTLQLFYKSGIQDPIVESNLN